MWLLFQIEGNVFLKKMHNPFPALSPDPLLWESPHHHAELLNLTKPFHFVGCTSGGWAPLAQLLPVLITAVQSFSLTLISVDTAVEGCEPLFYYSETPVTITRANGTWILWAFAVSSAHLSKATSWKQSVLQLTTTLFKGDGGKQTTAQELSCRLCNGLNHTVAGALCSQESAVARTGHFLRECTRARRRARCGLLNGICCLLWAFLWLCLRQSLMKLFSYNTVHALYLTTTRYMLSHATWLYLVFLSPCLLCVFPWTHPESNNFVLDNWFIWKAGEDGH